MQLRKDWHAFNATHTVELIQAQSQPLPPLAPTLGVEKSNVDQWSSIASANPFSFDRTDVTLTAPAPPQPAAPNVGPKPTLFGTLTIGDSKVAMLAGGQSGNRNASPVRIGEIIDGWELVAINNGTAAIRAGDRVETIVTNIAAQIPRQAANRAEAPVAVVSAAAPPPVISVASPTAVSEAAVASEAKTNAVYKDLPANIHPAPGSFIPNKEQLGAGSWVKTPKGDVFVFNPG